MLSGRGTLPDPDDTIVALASAPGPGARAIVRLSGRQARAIVLRLFERLDLEGVESRQWRSGAILVPGLNASLPATVCFWPAPKTYTGQDLAEIHTLSSPPLLQLLVVECLNAGARAAQPGEFTMRAFLAGKLDLTRAEAIQGVIAADSRERLKEALAQLAGGLAQPLHTLREDLLNLLADLEAGLDFADEDIQFVDQSDLFQRLTKGLAFITLVRKQIEQRALGHCPLRVVLAGAPNAGKSSLFNALVGSGKALVSSLPGTTRDWLEATLTLDGMTIQLVDTAGHRDVADAIEVAAQGLGQEQLRHADLVLWCREPSDLSEPPPLVGAVLPLATKVDLGEPPPNWLGVSTSTGIGLDQLRRELVRRARASAADPLGASLSRCRGHVEACLQHLRAAHRMAVEELPTELLALELRLALEELGAMVGAVYTDDLLDRIFSRFCIGK